MRKLPRLSGACFGAAMLISGCAEPPPPVTDTSLKAPAEPGPKVVSIDAGEGGPKRAQTALINAKPGDVIELGEGRFDFTSTLSLDVGHVTLPRARGP